MEPSPDEIAGVVDLFGALTRDQLGEALAELAFKRGGAYETDAFEGAIDAALEGYHLLAVEADGDAALVVGPVAFPHLPDGAADLPHILDVDPPEVDPERVATTAERRFRDDAATAVADGDRDRIATLLDVSYELEAWGGIDLSETRERLEAGQ